MEISKVPGGSSVIYFRDLGAATASFEKYDLVQTGHMWEAAIVIYCENNSLDLNGIEFDSESDLFAAYSHDERLLEELKSAINYLLTNRCTLESILANLNEQEDGHWSPTEFIEHLEFNKIDLDNSIELVFFIKYLNGEVRSKACKSVQAPDCTCYINKENEYESAFRVKIIPSINRLEEQLKYFINFSSNFEGDVEYFDEWELYELDKTSHWTIVI